MLILAAWPDDIGISSLLELEGRCDPWEFLLTFLSWELLMPILEARQFDMGTSSLLELDGPRDPRELLRPAAMGTSSLLELEGRRDPLGSLWDLLDKDPWVLLMLELLYGDSWDLQ